MQEEILNIIRGDTVDIQSFFQLLTPEQQQHAEAVSLLTASLVEWSLQDSPQEYCNDPLLPLAGKAALYHDIGMVLIPAQILHKTEELTAAEYRVIQQHASYGSTLLEKHRKSFAKTDEEKRFWNLAAEIALCHHEQWDGKGYPYGQLATVVPTAVRIVAIADAFDCMVRGAPYRIPLPREYALVEIIHYAGRQFDPQLIEIFRNHYDALLNI